jgi:hypothetical protein
MALISPPPFFGIWALAGDFIKMYSPTVVKIQLLCLQEINLFGYVHLNIILIVRGYS